MCCCSISTNLQGSAVAVACLIPTCLSSCPNSNIHSGFDRNPSKTYRACAYTAIRQTRPWWRNTVSRGTPLRPPISRLDKQQSVIQHQHQHQPTETILTLMNIGPWTGSSPSGGDMFRIYRAKPHQLLYYWLSFIKHPIDSFLLSPKTWHRHTWNTHNVN